MFENIRIEAERGAPEHYTSTGSVYFRGVELQKLHTWTGLLADNFAPSNLPFAILLNSKENVEEEFQEASVDGKYFGGEQPSIHLCYDDLNGYARAVFWHEYGHHLWFSLNVELKAEWRELERLMPSNSSYQKASALDEFAGTPYLTLPKELWARLFCQYMLIQVGDHEAWSGLAQFPEVFWTLEDIRQFASAIDAILRKLQFIVRVQAGR